MLIRPYQPNDRAACLVIIRGNTPLYFTAAEETEFSEWLDGQDAAVSGFAQTDHYYVAELDGQVVACGGFHWAREAARATLAWGMVDLVRHRQGLGRALLEHRRAAIRQLHPGAIIELDTTQHSYLFFEKLGFRVCKVTANFYGPGLNRCDMESPLS